MDTTIACRKSAMMYTKIVCILVVCLMGNIEVQAAEEIRIFQVSKQTIDTSSKHFVIVITSYNNKQWYLNNITSACNQVHDNFEIIFTDDCSDDDTGNLVESFLEHNPPPCNVTLIKNRTRRGAFQNIYSSIARCKPEDIIVSLDGDDCLAHNHVLSKLNTVYANKNVWMTHGQFLLCPGNTVCDWAQKMPADVIKNNRYRSHPNIPTHLRTFYVWLFRKIKLEDLLHEGSFYPVTWDMAFMLPMIEMTGGKHAFIDEILYLYNTGNPINDFKTSRALQSSLELKVRAKKAYQPLQSAYKTHAHSDTKAVTILITSKDNPTALKLFIDSAQKFLQPLTKMHIVWHATSPDLAKEYRSLALLHPENNFVEHGSIDFYQQLFYYLRTNKGNLLISNAYLPFTQPIDLEECIQALHDTQAFGFYFVHQETSCEFKQISFDERIQAWQFFYTPEQWRQKNPCIAALYQSSRALDMLIDYEQLHQKALYPFAAHEKIGLFLKS